MDQTVLIEIPETKLSVVEVAEKLRAVRQALEYRGRYIAIMYGPTTVRIPRGALDVDTELADDDIYAEHSRARFESRYHVVGGGNVYTYKTVRGARKAAGAGGFVCVFDLSRLPIVDDAAVAAGVDDLNQIDELSFAERQMLIWSKRVLALGGKL